VAARLCGGLAGALVTVHRDLHDKQLLVDDEGAVGILDFDTLATGEAALDLGNLVVHLELRALQGACTAGAARAAREALLDAYAPDEALLVRAGTYAQATRLRLACLYALRPAPPAVVPELLSRLDRWASRPAPAAGSHRARPPL
nr:phosphotransferase [Solirubrobacterales bacterium]